MQKDLIRYRKFQSSTGQARKLQEISQQFLNHSIQAGKHTARYVPHVYVLDSLTVLIKLLVLHASLIHMARLAIAFCCSCREDAFAALQLYLQHVRNDPALMTYQELVDFELCNLPILLSEDTG